MKKFLYFFIILIRALQLDMSFSSRFEERGLLIEGTKASIKGDLLENEITIDNSNKKKVLYKKKTKQNEYAS